LKGFIELKKLLEKLKKEIDSKNHFEYWKYIEESELLCKKTSELTQGTVEENVAIKGKLRLGLGSLIKSGSRIEGNVIIGNNCTIGPNAFLRNNTVLADNVRVGMSEIKNSIVLSNSTVPHFNYVGDSVLGENVNLGAGTKIANLRFDNATVKVMLNGKKIDSKRRKLGALLCHNVKTGINSCINCGTIVKKGEFVKPNEFYSSEKN
jgi:UDP-N-acetylglucosamine diphosphorylase / glucose-1-phosphate thymidylyltransferase / UDP-N-acetylgalactosamine diphosphorylase / glucosamine-1-phosphate N-acetyltransferase / galactosamine-1-phosphate N-acetyltransferase